MQHFDERLTAPTFWWFATALLGVTCGLTLLPLGILPMLVGLVAGGALAALGVSVYGAVRIRVMSGHLVAGDARIPVSALGTAHPLAREDARAWRSHKADPRAFMLLRAYIPTAVRVEVTDPKDPTPYVYLSSRRPNRLVAALDAARAESDEPTTSGAVADAVTDTQSPTG